jgi:hypothetical protein
MNQPNGALKLARTWSVWQFAGMSSTSVLYRGFRFPAEIIH